MAIYLECINIIIPISKVIDIIGLSGFNEISKMKMSHDNYLYRTGAMSPFDISLVIAEWKKMGLKPTAKRKGVEYWRDLCVVDAAEGPTLPCDWLEFDSKASCVRYKKKDGRVCE
ncbi:MAG: hypothetical protein JRG71_04775 [Deltaproteobacteria bacterium]|nr:hypothetical protein [Deltaproteobacteria bacterium]